MSEQTIQVLFAVALPLAVTAALVAGVALAGRRGGGVLLAKWAVPAAAAGCALASYLAQMRGRSGRWQWLVPALIVLPLIWALLLMLKPKVGRGRFVVTGLVAFVLAATAGTFVWKTIYEGQPWTYGLVAPAAVFALSAALFPLAHTATVADAIVVSLAGLATAAVVVLGQFLGAAELLAPAAVAAGTAGVGSLFFRDEATLPARRGLIGGALAAGLLLPVAAPVGWLNSYGLTPVYAWAFVLPAAGLPLLWLSRLPVAKRRPRLAAVVVFVLALVPSVVGLSLALAHTDLRPFGITYGQKPADDFGW